jgi:hypothetical protein
MTEKEVKELKNGDYVEVEKDGCIYIGPINHLSKPEKYSCSFYTEFCANKPEWNLEEIGVKAEEIRRYLPELMSVDDQIKKYYPQYFI